MCPRHCADAVLSLTNTTTLVGLVSGAITNFAALWTQTPSGYDFLVAEGLCKEFVVRHGAVISHQGGKHYSYSKYNSSRPGGALVLCHNRACTEPVIGRAQKGQRSHLVEFKCPQCRSSCITPNVTTNQHTTLGRHAIVKTPYPLPQYPAEWTWPEDFKKSWADSLAGAKDLPITVPPLPSASPLPPSLPPPPHPFRKRVQASEMTRSTSLPAQFPHPSQLLPASSLPPSPVLTPPSLMSPAPTPTSSSGTIRIPPHVPPLRASRSHSTLERDSGHDSTSITPHPTPSNLMRENSTRKRPPPLSTQGASSKKSRSQRS